MAYLQKLYLFINEWINLDLVIATNHRYCVFIIQCVHQISVVIISEPDAHTVRVIVAAPDCNWTWSKQSGLMYRCTVRLHLP